MRTKFPHNITELETDFVLAICESHWMYLEHVMGYCKKVTVRQCPGVVGSLVKKGYITAFPSDGSDSIELTKAGISLQAKLEKGE